MIEEPLIAIIANPAMQKLLAAKKVSVKEIIEALSEDERAKERAKKFIEWLDKNVKKYQNGEIDDKTFEKLCKAKKKSLKNYEINIKIGGIKIGQL